MESPCSSAGAGAALPCIQPLVLVHQRCRCWCLPRFVYKPCSGTTHIVLVTPPVTVQVSTSSSVRLIPKLKAGPPFPHAGDAVRPVACKQHQLCHEQQHSRSRARPSPSARTTVRLGRTGLLPLGAVRPALRAGHPHLPPRIIITGTRTHGATTYGRLCPQLQHKHRGKD